MKRKYFNYLIWLMKSKWSAESGPRRYLMKDNPKLSDYSIGDYSYGLPKILFSTSGNRLKIGKYVSVADGVEIFLGGEHRNDWISTYPLNQYFDRHKTIVGHPSSKGDVIIGNDVWIGRGAVIMSGITIGDGAVVGARSLVSKNVAPYSIVAGNPARHIRYRFTKEKIDALLKLAWWNWPEEKVESRAELLLSDDITRLIEIACEQ